MFNCTSPLEGVAPSSWGTAVGGDFVAHAAAVRRLREGQNRTIAVSKRKTGRGQGTWVCSSWQFGSPSYRLRSPIRFIAVRRFDKLAMRLVVVATTFVSARRSWCFVKSNCFRVLMAVRFDSGIRK